MPQISLDTEDGIYRTAGGHGNARPTERQRGGFGSTLPKQRIRPTPGSFADAQDDSKGRRPAGKGVPALQLTAGAGGKWLSPSGRHPGLPEAGLGTPAQREGRWG